LEGFGSGITTIKPKSGVDTGIISYMGCGTVESPNCGGSVAFLSMNGAGVRRLRILGDGNTTTPGTQTKAAIYTAYAYLGRWDDVKIEFWGGYGMYWRSTFDHDINASFMRWTGSGVGGRESWFFDNDLGGSGVYPVNELRVVNSDFEGDINAFVKSVGLNNNSIGFVNTKFETTNLNTTYTPIVINTAAQSNWTFSACRFNGYWSAPAFLSASLLNGAYIQGVNFNSGSPTAFATLTDSSAISINVRGFNPGQVTQSGNSQYNAISSVDEFSQGSSTYLMNTPEFRSLNLREVGGYKIANDAGATQGYAIQGQSTDNTFQVNIPINQTTQTKNGITVYFKMKSSSAKGYKIQVNNFGASVSQDITPVSVTTSYAWYQGSIPHQYMTANTAGPTYVGIVSTTGQAGITLSISDIYYENKYFTGGSACPDSDGTSYTWTLGDIVYWPQSTPAAGLPTACVATASGSPGTWRTFGLIDMLNTALTFNGAVAFSQNTVFNAGLSSISAPGTFNLIASGHTGATSGTNISCGLQAQNDNLNVKYICTDGSSTRVPWGTDWTNSIWFSAQLLQSQQGIEFTPVLVANLGTPTRSGVRKFVSNASTTVAAGVGTIVAGGGTNIVPVYWDGTNWRIG
jgi:hypothetical protein